MDLRPCIKCGSNETRIEHVTKDHWNIDEYDKTIEYGYYAICDNCQFSTKIFYHSEYLEPIKEATSAWNSLCNEFENFIIKECSFHTPYPVITLCGSTKFKNAFNYWSRLLSLLNSVVITVNVFQDDGYISAEIKRKLDKIHFQKILMSSDVLILNVDNYIGLSTWDEIFFSLANKKNVYFVDPFNNKCLLDFYDFAKSEGANVLTHSSTGGIIGLEFEPGQLGTFVRKQII